MLAGDNRFYFKTPINQKGGDIIWRYDDIKGIWTDDGIPFIEKELKKILDQKLKTRHLTELIKLFQVATYCKPEDFQEDQETIVLLNGEYNLITNTIEPFSPEHCHKNRLPIAYNPEATNNNFQKFLTEVAPGDENSIQELFGYLLCKSYPIQKCFIFQGSGANGKSTLLRVMEAFLGKENCSSVGLYDLVTKTFSKAELYGRLANIAPDIGSDELKKTGIFKALTGGDTITAERKNQHPFQFTNYAKMIFSCNQLPTSPDNSDAFFRRFMIYQFKNVFNEENADPNILAKITTQEELSGIFNWALEGYKRLFTQMRFTEGKSTKDTRDIYLGMADPINAFVNEMVEEDNDAVTVKNDIWRIYGEFCQRKGFILCAENKFFSRLKSLVYFQETQITRDKTRIRAWRGIRLKIDLNTIIENAQDTQDAQDVYTQSKIVKLDGYVGPVQSVHPVQLPSLEEKLSRIASIFDGKTVSTDYLVAQTKWPEDEVRKLLGCMLRDGVIFRVPQESDVWRWSC